MTRYIAFLRAINVGGHTVKMEALRELFSALGLAQVETFIASGNVIFETAETEPRALEARIAHQLGQALGYGVATFVRSNAALARIAAYRPFPQAEAEGKLYIGFLAGLPPAEVQEKLLAARTPSDDFHFHGSELYWLVHTRLSESIFSGALLEKILGVPTTVRNRNTVERLMAKYPFDDPTGGA